MIDSLALLLLASPLLSPRFPLFPLHLDELLSFSYALALSISSGASPLWSREAERFSIPWVSSLVVCLPHYYVVATQRSPSACPPLSLSSSLSVSLSSIYLSRVLCNCGLDPRGLMPKHCKRGLEGRTQKKKKRKKTQPKEGHFRKTSSPSEGVWRAQQSLPILSLFPTFFSLHPLSPSSRIHLHAPCVASSLPADCNFSDVPVVSVGVRRLAGRVRLAFVQQPGHCSDLLAAFACRSRTVLPRGVKVVAVFLMLSHVDLLLTFVAMLLPHNYPPSSCVGGEVCPSPARF